MERSRTSSTSHILYNYNFFLSFYVAGMQPMARYDNLSISSTSSVALSNSKDNMTYYDLIINKNNSTLSYYSENNTVVNENQCKYFYLALQ